jgi:hypothetical protein
MPLTFEGKEIYLRDEPHYEDAVYRWSGPRVPAIGDVIRVTMNDLGWAKVLGYGITHGWLYVRVHFFEPPGWYVNQNGGNISGCVFGIDIDWDTK